MATKRPDTSTRRPVGDNSDKTSLGVLRPGLTPETSIRMGKTVSVRLERDIAGQNRKGCGKPN